MDRSSHWRLAVAAATLAALSVADFVGLLVIAALTAVVVGMLTNFSTFDFLEWVPIDGLAPEAVIPLLGAIAVALIATKTFVSWHLTRKIYLFTATREPMIAGRVYATYLSAPFAASQALSRTQVGVAVGQGASALMSLINAGILIFADIALIGLLTILLLLASPLLFLCAFAYFGLLAWGVSRIVGGRSSRYGKQSFEATVAAGETTMASVGFAPEIRLYGIVDKFSERLHLDLFRAATVNAKQQVLFQAPRYVFEMGVIVGFVVVASTAFLLQAPADAAFTVALFMLSSARMVPALQRLSANWGRLRLSKAKTAALAPILHLPTPEVTAEDPEATGFIPPKDALLVFNDVGYRYPGAESPSLSGVNLTIKRGTRVAFVGRTGSGKSTLANLVAGLAEPSSGSVWRTGGDQWRNQIAIVPQDVYLAPDSVRNNVAMPVLGAADDDGRIWEALEMAQVADVVRSLPDALDTELGERGSRISGGEAQRLGLARALYRRPLVLVLDEATSSLDAATEKLVSSAIRSISSDCTVVQVAHRLATVRDADLVVLLDSGLVVAQGSFDEVMAASSAFAHAAALQGLVTAGDAADT